VTYLSTDLYCGHAPQQKALVFDALVPQGQRRPAFIPTGNPRNDRFLEYVRADRGRRAEIQARAKRFLGLSPDRKMVLIASHWTPDGLLRTFGTGPIQAVSVMDEDFQIVQGVHPNLWDDPQHDSFQLTVRNSRQDGFSSRWIREALVREEERGVNVQWGIENNLAVLACDAMIADHSSIVVEAAILDKPVVCYLRRARFDAEFAYVLYRDAVVQFERCGDLPGALRETLADPEDKVLGRERMRSMFAFNLGGASEKIARLVLERYRAAL
jgi:CDP-glycerol glycerophosphotransferase (TagB/SpsB family)